MHYNADREQHSKSQNLLAPMLPAMQTINPKHWSEKHEGGEEVQMTLNPRFACF